VKDIALKCLQTSRNTKFIIPTRLVTPSRVSLYSIQSIPQEISEQLKRVEYLSSTTISMLKMDK
jgi:hypothetical protein